MVLGIKKFGKNHPLVGAWCRARGAMLDALGKRDKDSDLPIPLSDLISAGGPAWKWT